MKGEEGRKREGKERARGRGQRGCREEEGKRKRKRKREGKGGILCSCDFSLGKTLVHFTRTGEFRSRTPAV